MHYLKSFRLPNSSPYNTKYASDGTNYDISNLNKTPEDIQDEINNVLSKQKTNYMIKLISYIGSGKYGDVFECNLIDSTNPSKTRNNIVVKIYDMPPNTDEYQRTVGKFVCDEEVIRKALIDGDINTPKIFFQTTFKMIT